MKKAHVLLVGTILATSIVASSVAVAGLTGNSGVANNYILRGITQTTDESNISGGIDYAHDSGFHAGTWVSNENWTGPGNITITRSA